MHFQISIQPYPTGPILLFEIISTLSPVRAHWFVANNEPIIKKFYDFIFSRQMSGTLGLKCPVFQKSCTTPPVKHSQPITDRQITITKENNGHCKLDMVMWMYWMNCGERRHFNIKTIFYILVYRSKSHENW